MLMPIVKRLHKFWIIYAGGTCFASILLINSFKMKLITFITAGAFIFLSAFTIHKKHCQDPSLYGVRWSLKKIHSDTTCINVTTRAYIRFDKEKKSAGGNGSCNV